MSADGRAGNSARLVGHEEAVEVDDSVLWSRARTGDCVAFGMLFERHQRVDDEELMGRALELVARLPRHEQEVFALCAWSELSYEDAAFALRIPVGTVRSRLSRARARLRELDPGIGHDGERMQMIKKAVER